MSWTAEAFSYLSSIKLDDKIEFKAEEILAVKSKRGLGWNTNYTVFWVIPLVIGLGAKLMTFKIEELDYKAVAFAIVVCTLFLALVFLLQRKNRAYLRKVKELNEGKEFILVDQALLISAGEMDRGEANRRNFSLSGLVKWARTENVRYFRIDFKDCSHYSLEDRTLFLVPSNGTKNTFELVIGLSKADLETAKNIGAHVGQWLKKEKRNTLLEV